MTLVALFLGARDITIGGLNWSDAPLHTFDGIFCLELAKETLDDASTPPKKNHLAGGASSITAGAASEVSSGGVESLRNWSEQFYLRHPSFGILVYYPPGFALIEAAVFAVCGVNITAARATVIGFAIGAAILTYLLGKRWFSRWPGLMAALLLLTCPHGVLWMRDVMLEWPATFWILAAVYAYWGSIEPVRPHERSRRACSPALLGTPPALFAPLATIIFATMAFFTKQTAGFIIPVLIVHAILTRSNRRAWRRPILLVVAGMAAIAIGGYLVISNRYAALPGQLLIWSPDWLFLPRSLPEILGWPLLVLVLLTPILLSMIRFASSRIVSPRRDFHSEHEALASAAAPVHRTVAAFTNSCLFLLLLWFGAWVLFSTAIAGVAGEPRYLFFALPPLLLAVIGGIALARPSCSEWRVTTASVVLLALLVAIQLGLALRDLPPRLPTFAPAVAELAARPDADLVMIDSVRDGQFVFDIYQNGETRDRIVPIRASKLLYARAAREKFDYRQFVDTEADIVTLLNRYGIRYVVLESALPRTLYQDADPPPRRMLRRLVEHDGRFSRVAGWPLKCDDPIWDNVELRLYRYDACPLRTAATITFDMPSMGRPVTLRFPPPRS